jgi:hypothetical protein
MNALCYVVAQVHPNTGTVRKVLPEVFAHREDAGDACLTQTWRTKSNSWVVLALADPGPIDADPDDVDATEGD